MDDGPRPDKGKEEFQTEADKSNPLVIDIDEDLTRTCAGCKLEIGNENYLGCMGTFFHPECCHCHECGHPIIEHEGNMPTTNHVSKNALVQNVMSVINLFQQMKMAYLSTDATQFCHRCTVLPMSTTIQLVVVVVSVWRYISLEEGRSLCEECKESAIMDTDACQPLYHAIRDFYERLNMKINQQFPVLLVERQAFNDALEKEKNGPNHTEPRGLCLSESQTIISVLKRPTMGGRGLVGIRTQPQMLTRKSEVTAILVLFGFPRLLTGAILAHELMHAWLRLHGYRNLRPEIEEGICQVASHMWLKSEVEPEPTNTTPSVEKKLGEFFLYQIANMASPAYGGGFRAAMTSTSRYGFRRTLDHIRLTGNFPL